MDSAPEISICSYRASMGLHGGLGSHGAGCPGINSERRQERSTVLKFVALAVWGGTACFGLYLLVIWL